MADPLQTTPDGKIIPDKRPIEVPIEGTNIVLEFPAGTPNGVIDLTVRRTIREEQTKREGGMWPRSGTVKPSTTVDQITGELKTGAQYLGSQAIALGSGLVGLPGLLEQILPSAKPGSQLDLLNKERDAQQRARGREPLRGAWTPSEIQSWAHDVTGLPQVTGQDILPPNMRDLGPYMDAGVQGMMGGGALGRLRPGAVTAGGTGGVTSEAAGNLPGVQGTALEPWARLAGGAVGAGAGAAVPATAKYGWQVGKSMVDPLTLSGRDKIIGAVLNRAATNPTAAATDMTGFRTRVPGSQPTAAQAANDPGLLAFENQVKGQPGASGQLAIQNAENNAARTAAADRIAPPVTAEQAGDTLRTAMQVRKTAFEDARSNVAGPMYEAAKVMDPAIAGKPILDFINNGIMRETGQIRDALKTARGALYLGEGQGRRLASTVGEWQAVKRALDEQIGQAKAGSPLERQLVLVRNEVDGALKAGPMFNMADKTFSTMSAPLRPYTSEYGPRVAKALETGPFNGPYTQPSGTIPGEFLNRGTTGVDEALAAAGKGPTVKQAFVGRMMDDFKSAIRTTTDDPLNNKVLSAAAADRWWQANRAVADKVMTPAQMKAMDAIIEDFGVSARRAQGVSGSNTAQNLASGNMLNAVLRFPMLAQSGAAQSTMGRTLSFLYKWPEEQLQARLIEVVRDPKVASALMVKASEGNAKILAPMLRRALEGTGGTVPLAGEGR